MSNLRIIIIDEPIHIQDPLACEIWRKALWLKEQEYQLHYRSSILPLSVDDFFGTHIIIAEELGPGNYAPISMYKVTRASQYARFGVPFGGLSILNGTPFENSIAIHQLLREPGDIGYMSSWATSPDYRKRPRLAREIRNLITTAGVHVHALFGYHRWIVAGVTRHKADQYFIWAGCREILPEFSLPIIDNQTVRMLYLPDTRNMPAAPLEVAKKYHSYWENRLCFQPQIQTHIQPQIATNAA